MTDELTLLRDAHRVDTPDTELVQRERATLDAHIATDQPSPRSSRRRRRVRGPLIAGALSVGVLAGVGAVAASGLLDQNTADMVESAPCNITIDNAQLITSATDSRGDTIELWVLDSADGWGNLIVEKAPDGTWIGSTMGCSPEARSNGYYGTDNGNGHPWAGAPSVTDSEATLVRLYGWIPAPATTAIVVLTDGTTVEAEAGDDGYFLHPVAITPSSDIDIAHIQAVTADGTVIASNP